MSFANEISQRGGTPRTLDVQADVSLGPDRAGGFRLTGIVLTVSGDVDELERDQFIAAAEAAKVGCPVSKALTGVDITLNVGAGAGQA
jgi:osmotically inducible protein OsmC